MKNLISPLMCYLPILFCSYVAADARKDIEHDLRKVYEHRMLSLRTPSTGNSLQFDSQGRMADSADPCPWSVCGLLQVEKLMVSQDSVEVRGKRVILALRAAQPKIGVIPLATDREIRIKVGLPSWPMDVPQINNTLSKVFEGGEILERVAKYWKPEFDFDRPDFAGQIKALHARNPNAVVAELERDRPVYMVTPGVIDPPKPIQNPDPEYTQSALQQRLQGKTTVMVVINEKGLPEVLEIIKGLGGDLDLRALTTVAGWTFQPAMKNGNPVEVLIYVEVTFHLD